MRLKDSEGFLKCGRETGCSGEVAGECARYGSAGTSRPVQPGCRIVPKYRVRCIGGGEYVEDPSLMNCGQGHDALLRSEYSHKKLVLSPYCGIFRYLCWLPVINPLLPSGGPVTFRNESLCRELGLENLMISFSGYSPERGADLATGSFKELEALATLQRLKEIGRKIPVVASAGNTGRAFAEIASRCHMPVVIVVPETSRNLLWTTQVPENVYLVAVKGDYSDAIAVSTTLASVPGCIPEGGAKNIARRDAMGTVMLDAAVTTGRMPEYYFQAVGSGTGGIAAWEAALRLQKDGGYGNRLPCLHLAQNEPFTPMVSAWRDHRRRIVPEMDMQDAQRTVNQVMSNVLTNRNPPYSIRGGLYDALEDTDGVMYSVSNTEGQAALRMVRDAEDLDLDPAAAIATAALVQAVEQDRIGVDSHILLNLTGGGYERIREDFTLHPIEPAFTLYPEESRDGLVEDLKEWIVNHG
jgi:cysteate synthase